MRPKKRQGEDGPQTRINKSYGKIISLGKSAPKSSSKRKLLKRKLNQNLKNLQILSNGT